MGFVTHKNNQYPELYGDSKPSVQSPAIRLYTFTFLKDKEVPA